MRTIIPIFSIGIACTIFFAFIQPLFSDVQTIQSEIERMKEQLSKKIDLTTEVENLLSVKQSHAVSNIERLDAMIPEYVDEVKIIADIHALARSHNMLFGNIVVESTLDTNTDADAEEFEELNGVGIVSSDISFELIGTYDQFKQMLGDIERSLVLLDVLHISFTAGAGELVQYTVKVRTYAMPKVTS